MVDQYFAICMQTTQTGISHKKEIKEANLKRKLELISYAVRKIGFRDYAPARLLVFPEVFLQGWCSSPAPYSNIYEKISKDMAIEIPGEETELLAEKAREFNVYIAGTAHEIIPGLGLDRPFNCGFIISPKGEIIYKYHKFYPVIRYTMQRDDISPHDVYDKYLEVMDGKYGRKSGDIVSCFFPVVETDIGKLGYIICNDGHWPENARALGLQGCEVMLRSSGMTEPWGSPPQQKWEIQNRSAALFNMMYVVACSQGERFEKGHPTMSIPGQSMVVDFHGALLQHSTATGEAVTGAVINIEDLRKRRMDPKYNVLTQLRTEVYQEMYSRPVYPKNLYLNELPSADPRQRSDAQPIKRFIEEGIFIPPYKP